MMRVLPVRCLLVLALAAACFPLVGGAAVEDGNPAGQLARAPVKKCITCDGTGQVRCGRCTNGKVYVGNGVYKPCGYCAGIGSQKCFQCGGTGVR